MIILNTIYFIGFVLALTGIIAVCKVALDVIFVYEEQQAVTTQKMTDAMLLAHNDMLANLQANKEAGTSSINETTATSVLSAQEAIDNRALELKRLIAEKRAAREQHGQNNTVMYLDMKQVTA